MNNPLTSKIKAINHWNLKASRVRNDLIIAGSPERCEQRFVIECENGQLYTLENIFEPDLDHKILIIKSLNYLSGQNASYVLPYMCTPDQKYIVRHGNRLWQLIPFIDGETLDRPAYVFDRWRGKILAGFLYDLKKASKDIPFFKNSPPFSIKTYVTTLIQQIKENDTHLIDIFLPVYEFLAAELMQVHDILPVTFCHGDYHPLNIIWGRDDIKAVIDWEFCGIKPEIFDAANLLSCIGIEDPNGLTGDLVLDFICCAQNKKLFADISWEYLLDFIIAIRFAWLSEWLRHKDKEMIDLEATYMKLLMENKNYLKNLWGI